MKIIAIILINIVLLVVDANSQKPPFCISDNEMVLRLDKRTDKKENEALLKQYDLQLLPIDSAFLYGNAGQLSKDGWQIRRKNKNVIEVFKKLDEVQKINLIGNPFFVDEGASDSSKVAFGDNTFNNRIFGYNIFKTVTVIELNDSITQFICYGRNKAQNVFLSGSFNNWSTQGLPMVNLDGAWRANVKLRPGRHEYKFIVDGRWIGDEENKLKINDNADGHNSVYFKPNKKFILDNYPDAKKVILAGSFNNWNENEIEFHKVAGRWICNVFLPDGMYYYKFIVDGIWITDPNNKNSIEDGSGNTNSFLSLGSPTKITLNGFKNAQSVVLSGSFNNWAESGTILIKSETGWEIDYVLQPGNYYYKFIVDGEWIYDPSAPTVPNEYNSKNNFLVVEPNHTFYLDDFQDAKEVFLLGTFNEWIAPGYAMQKSDSGWILSLNLNRGKTLYKYVVDGKWIRDPHNNLWEDNGIDSGNSVIWIGSDSPNN